VLRMPFAARAMARLRSSETESSRFAATANRLPLNKDGSDHPRRRPRDARWRPRVANLIEQLVKSEQVALISEQVALIAEENSLNLPTIARTPLRRANSRGFKFTRLAIRSAPKEDGIREKFWFHRIEAQELDRPALVICGCRHAGPLQGESGKPGSLRTEAFPSGRTRNHYT
jgi:hypothetical protein